MFSYSVRAGRVGLNGVVLSFGGNARFAATSTNKTFNVTAKATKITINSISKVKKGNTATITGKFTDSSGNPLRLTTLTLSINGNKYYAKTDSNGVYSYSYKTTTVGTNNVVISYGGNERYAYTTSKLTFTVTK